MTRIFVSWISTLGMAALGGQHLAGLKACTTYEGFSVRGLRSAVCDFAHSPLPVLQHAGVMYHAPQWSPDGQWILASGTIDGDAELFLIPVAGGAAKKLTDNNASDDLAIWIDTGRRILFESDRRGKMEKFVMNADGSGARLAESEQAPPATSPDRRYELHEEGGAIVLVDRTTKARQTVTSGLWSEQPSFSPDGRSIAFEQRSSSNPHAVETSNIVVARSDGSGARVITPGTDPSWSPDGQRLVFKVWEASTQKLFITTARPDGSDLRRLSDGVHPQWSPDGRRIAFMRDQAHGTHIWVMNADGTGKRCITCP
jgi:Tol biopolymer transport system component